MFLSPGLYLLNHTALAKKQIPGNHQVCIGLSSSPDAQLSFVNLQVGNDCVWKIQITRPFTSIKNGLHVEYRFKVFSNGDTILMKCISHRSPILENEPILYVLTEKKKIKGVQTERSPYLYKQNWAISIFKSMWHINIITVGSSMHLCTAKNQRAWH